MPLPKTVTAQDFMDEVEFYVSNDGLFRVGYGPTKTKFDALLSRARQEAKIEAQMEKNRIVRKERSMRWVAVLECEKKVKEARREALKEMDEALQDAYEFFEGAIAPGQRTLEKLRAEYNQP